MKRQPHKKRHRNTDPDFYTNLYDNHHIFFQERHYLMPALERLREYWYCIVSIPKIELHQTIHEYVGDVPAPTVEVAREVVKQLEMFDKKGVISYNDPIEKRLIILIALLEDCGRPTANALEKQLYIVYDNKKAPHD